MCNIDACYYFLGTGNGLKIRCEGNAYLFTFNGGDVFQVIVVFINVHLRLGRQSYLVSVACGR